jgi:hypothetical protein
VTKFSISLEFEAVMKVRPLIVVGAAGAPAAGSSFRRIMNVKVRCSSSSAGSFNKNGVPEFGSGSCVCQLSTSSTFRPALGNQQRA